MNQADTRFMALALSLGRRGLGRTWPNPSVGCVIVKDGRIIGRGWTQPGGRPHAERVALAQAGSAAHGAVAYVTLEPCSHHGKTSPCSDALIEAGVARVVAALEDPNPHVCGQGFARLRAAGIEVTSGVCADEAALDHIGFLKVQTQGLPLVTLKLASSFDGRIATASGESKWITGAEARRLVHLMRSRHDAVLVGGGTVRADDPSLTVRGLGMAHQPARVVWSRRLDLPLTGKLAKSAVEIPLWICCGEDAAPELRDAWAGLGAKIVPVAVGPSGQVDPKPTLRSLAAMGITRIFCEGGGALAASLLASDSVDALVGFTAGIALGAEGRPSLGAMGVDRLAAAPRFELHQSWEIGGDVMHHWLRR